MHTNETKDRFIFHRSRGWSLARIAEELNVSKPTLIEWNREFKHPITAMRAVQLEWLQEQILIAHKTDLLDLDSRMEAVKNALSKRKLDDVPTEKLFQLSSLLRAETAKVRAAVMDIEEDSQYMPSPDGTPGFVDFMNAIAPRRSRRNPGPELAETDEKVQPGETTKPEQPPHTNGATDATVPHQAPELTEPQNP